MGKTYKDGRDKSAGPKAQRVRFGGGVGSEELEKLAQANEEGAGVTLNIKTVGSDPNEGTHLAPEQTGAEI